MVRRPPPLRPDLRGDPWQVRPTGSFSSAISAATRKCAAPKTAGLSPRSTSQPRKLGATGRRASAEKTEWHRVVIFNESLAKVAEEYLKKGAKVYVEGQLQTRKWQDNQGHDRYSTEVVLQGFNATLTMLGGRREGSGYRAGGDGPEDYGIDGDRAAGRSSSQPSQSFERELADDIPF